MQKSKRPDHHMLAAMILTVVGNQSKSKAVNAMMMCYNKHIHAYICIQKKHKNYAIESNVCIS